MPADGVLEFVYVGFTTVETPVNGRTTLDVALTPDAESLEETIVVAYGVAKKSSFTGSASQMKGDKIQKQQVSNISKSLEGAVAGLQTSSSSGTPGSASSIIIRGLGSISASQSPLIVVDGVPYAGSLNSISTQDIESLVVLKDAAANSMYGARGSNGVIVITTRQAKTDNLQVSFEGRFGFNDRGVAPYSVITNPGDYYEMMYESISNSLYNAGYSRAYANEYTAKNLINGYLKYNVYQGIADDQLIDPMTGKLNPAAKTLKWNDNWNKDSFERGARQEYNLNIVGGTANTKAYASVSYLDDKGYVVNSGFTRISARAKVDQNIGKFVKAGVNLAYSNTEQKQFGSTGSNYSNIFMFAQQIGPIYPIYLYDAEGNRVKDSNGNDKYDFGTEYQRPYAMEQNPLAVAKENLNDFVRDNVSSRAYVDVNILKDLKFTANVAYDVILGTNTEFTTPIGGDAASVNGRGYKYTSRNGTLNANQLLNYSPTFGKHSINILLGHETLKEHYNYLLGHMTNFMDSTNPEFTNAAMIQDLYSYTEDYALEGYFGRAEYSYADKYYISGSYRRDASSRFAPEVRWGSFWSVGGSWRISEESFLKGSNVLTNARLKASYGTQGNDNLGYSTLYLDLYSISRVDGEHGITKTFRGNPDLTWEKSNNFNVGLELGFWHRLSINADFFIKETKDMLYARPLPPSQGSPSWMYVNDIDMKNTGIEFEISADIVKTNNVTWNVSLNGTHYKNEITKLPEDKQEAIAKDGGYQSGSYWRKIGGSIYDYYTYEYAGIDPENGKAQYNKYLKDDEGNFTGEVEKVYSTSEATLRQIGKSPIPALYGGLNTSLEAYGVDLSIATAYQIGGWAWDSVYQGMMNPGGPGENMHTDMFNRWTPLNKNSNVHALNYQDQNANGSSDRWLTSASYFSLRNVTLGYSLPQNVLRKTPISKLRIYLTGDNLWLKSARQGFDPRQSFSGSTGYVYSALATYSVGLNLVF